jgi:putative transcriptional regulator
MFCGGPVIGPLMAVHTEESFAEREILPGVFFAGKEENVLPLMRHTTQPYKIFTGYAGWGPGQLEHEVDQGVWRVAPATAERIFSSSDDLWEILSKEVFALRFIDLFNVAHIPADPILN